ncbi:hypothetical protein V8D89_002015 [Ganoderma adspersum]
MNLMISLLHRKSLASHKVITIDKFTKNERKTSECLAEQLFSHLPYIEHDGIEHFQPRPTCRFTMLEYGGIETPLPAQTDYTAGVELGMTSVHR